MTGIGKRHAVLRHALLPFLTAIATAPHLAYVTGLVTLWVGHTRTTCTADLAIAAIVLTVAVALLAFRII